MDLQIKGKKAIMAGGSAGMGRATAERLAEAGAELVLTARREERLLQAAAEISEKYGVSVTPVVADSLMTSMKVGKLMCESPWCPHLKRKR